jgi:hypothetical protein
MAQNKNCRTDCGGLQSKADQAPDFSSVLLNAAAAAVDVLHVPAGSA